MNAIHFKTLALSLIFITTFSLAEDQQVFNPVDSTVVVHNPNMLGYHFYCLGLVDSQESVVVPRECAVKGLHGAITVYPTPEDSDADKNGISAQSNINQFSEQVKAVTLRLNHSLTGKKIAKIEALDLTCSKLWNCYYLALQQEKMVINRRPMRTPGSVNAGIQMTGNAFKMITEADDVPELSADYIKGAILFNAENEVVAIGYDDLSIYSLYLGRSHQFYWFNHMYFHQ